MKHFNFKATWHFLPPSLLNAGMGFQMLRNLALAKAEHELFRHNLNQKELPPKVSEMRYRIVPCPYRDHYEDAHRIIQRCVAKALDEGIDLSGFDSKKVARVRRILEAAETRRIKNITADDLQHRG